jgi:hypothetical protein
VASSD